MKRSLFTLLFIFCGTVITFSQTSQSNEEYVCSPCGSECDATVYNKAGTCPHCNMPLVKKSTVVFKSIQPEDLCGYIAKHPGVVILDVRSKKEYEGRAFPDHGTLKNAINIPIDELNGRLSELTAHKNKEIIVYCSHSKRSSRASYTLTQNGFAKVTNMAGGLSELDDDSCKK